MAADPLPGAPSLTVQLGAHLQALGRRVAANEAPVRAHDPHAVHQMRVALRTLRSLLATYRPLLADPATVQHLRLEMGWLAGELAGARDSEVVGLRLARDSHREPTLAALFQQALTRAQESSADRTTEALDARRYAALRHDLDAFLADPPWRSDLTDEDGEVRQVLRREVRRLRKRMRQAALIGNDEERAPVLHEVRKQAKRLRYAAESVQSAYGSPAQLLGRHASRIQTELGEIQDSAMCRAFLRRLSTDEGTTSGQAFLLGELHERERRLSLVAEERYAAHGGRLRKHGPATAWLS